MTTLFHGGNWNNDHDTECIKWPSVMQASYKASPAILDILTALYHPTEWLTLSSRYWVYCWPWSWAVRVWSVTRKWWESRVLCPAQWTIYRWEHQKQLVRLSWVDYGASWLLCSNHLGLYAACITRLTCNLMDALRYESCETGQSSFVIVMDSADDFTQLILQEDRNHKCNRIEGRLNCGKNVTENMAMHENLRSTYKSLWS